VSALPAIAESVAAFLACELERGIRSSTIGRRVAAIGYAHKLAGHVVPIEVPTGSLIRRSHFLGREFLLVQCMSLLLARSAYATGRSAAPPRFLHRAPPLKCRVCVRVLPAKRPRSWAVTPIKCWTRACGQISCRFPHDMHGPHSSQSNMKTSRDWRGSEIGDQIAHPRNLLPSYPDRY
jgi:hypothetical protein